MLLFLFPTIDSRSNKHTNIHHYQKRWWAEQYQGGLQEWGVAGGRWTAREGPAVVIVNGTVCSGLIHALGRPNSTIRLLGEGGGPV
ncbi:hypothetical protein J6590_010387 [Homalodisca vitripennis]|nr:hypothetical protein J6590_010387 [Homalodisca vitripennis]